LSTLAPSELVERIWERDPSVWTGGEEAQWLGWLDEPARMRERVHELLEYAARLEADVDQVVLLGMGGSSLAPEVMRRFFGAERFQVLDTTHPAAIRRLEASIDVGRTLFVAASKSGTTLETRSQTDYFLEEGGRFAVITDPGSPLAGISEDVFYGEPTIGGRYSALSVFGLLPAALMGIDLERLLDRAEEMREACRLEDGNPGLELGLRLADTQFLHVGGDFGLWVEQLVAESTGKEGKGIVPVREGGEALETRLPDPYELGQEFFRWEFATAVAGSIFGINPFDQPDVQAAKDKTQAVLSGRGPGSDPETRPVPGTGPGPEGEIDTVLAQAGPGRYIAIQAFIDPAREAELEPLVRRARETGAAVAVGLGPRYLHSTGQLHKGGPDIGLFVQVMDDPGEELPIPGQKFGFRTLIAAQAEGDFQALEERGRPIARIRLEDVG
jgi:transaldolase / glucose-6-phosphate isomerase